MPVKAFVLIVADPARTTEVFRQLSQTDGITEVYQVMGPYDVVAVIEVASLADVPSVVSTDIRRVTGIESTTTCVAFPHRDGAERV